MKIATLFLALSVLVVSQLASEEKVAIRVGHFPNITHTQALIGNQLTRQGKGWFEKRLGDNVKVEWYVYDAGPGAMEAVFAESIDLTYVGPGPTLNAFVKAPDLFKVVSGAASGGAALVVRSDSGIVKDSDFKGKKLATPQLGNTQDIAARYWLKSKGYTIKLTGGDVMVIPTEPADQIYLFQQNEIDAAWAVEPWVTRLITEGKGKIYFEESSIWPETNGEYVTTHLVSTNKFIKEQPELLKKWIQAQIELTEWIKNNPDEAKELVAKELKEETHVQVGRPVIDQAWKRIKLTYDPIYKSLTKDAQEAFEIGFLKKQPDVEKLYDLSFLNEILKRMGKEEIKLSFANEPQPK